MNQHPRGSEPPCPIQGPRCKGIIRTKGALACHPCSKLGANGVPKAASDNAVSVSGDECEIATVTAEPVRTLADLIRVCQIDTDERGHFCDCCGFGPWRIAS